MLARGEPYVLRDLDGTPVTPEQVKRIIAERYAVPDDVRRRRRSRKTARPVVSSRAPAASADGLSTAISQSRSRTD